MEDLLLTELDDEDCCPDEASCLSTQTSEELSELPLRVNDISRDQRRGGGGPVLPNGTCETLSDQLVDEE